MQVVERDLVFEERRIFENVFVFDGFARRLRLLQEGDEVVDSDFRFGGGGSVVLGLRGLDAPLESRLKELGDLHFGFQRFDLLLTLFV